MKMNHYDIGCWYVDMEMEMDWIKIYKIFCEEENETLNKDENMIREIKEKVYYSTHYRVQYILLLIHNCFRVYVQSQ
jgi:hypothetical protein